MTQPRFYVEAPEVEPYQHGLLSVAQPLPELDGDPHWMIGGVEWESLAAVPVSHYKAGLFAGHGAAATKSVPDSPGTISMWPSAIYGGVDCSVIGRPLGEYAERARRIVELQGQHAAEETLWSGIGVDTAAVPNPGLNGTGKATDVTGGASVSLVAGIALLEGWLGTNYGGRGVIHAPRTVAGYAAQAAQIVQDPNANNERLTQLGTRWCFGGGYDGSGPGGAPAAAGTAWLYGTGVVLLHRGITDVPATAGEALNRATNRQRVIAEQVFVVGVDGPWAAVHVTLP